jgi:hypothetical protein
MFRKMTIAGALAGSLLTALAGPAEARPAVNTAIATAEGVILVGRAGRGGGGALRGGGGRSFATRGGGGRSFAMRGGSGRNFAVRGGGGRGLALRRSGGPRVAGFAQRGPKYYKGGSAPRFADRGGRNFKGDGWKGRKFAGNFKHRRFGHKHRNRFAFYAGPAYYAYYDSGYSCGGLYRRAVLTGSRYWWRRYHACRDGYYYD